MPSCRILFHFPYSAPYRSLSSSSHPLFSLIIEPAYLNVSINLSQSIFLHITPITVSTLPSRLHTMTSVFFVITLIPFLSNASCYATTSVCNPFSASVNVCKSYTCYCSHDSSFLIPNTNTNTKEFSADPWCKQTVSGNTDDTSNYDINLVVAPSYMSCSSYSSHNLF